MAAMCAAGLAWKEGKAGGSSLDTHLKGTKTKLPLSLSSISLASTETSDGSDPSQKSPNRGWYVRLSGLEEDSTRKMVENLGAVEKELDSVMVPVSVAEVKGGFKMCTLTTDVAAFRRRRDQAHKS